MPSGECFLLGPADLEVTTADVRLTSERQDGPAGALLLTFDNDDGKRFAVITRSNLRKRLAIVMFGKVIVAPAIMVPIEDGQAQIVGPNRDDLKRLAKSLSD